MANNRPAIRSALKAMLSGNTGAGTNVYSHRQTRLWESELPAILIYSNQEPAQPESLRSTRSIRNLELTIEVRLEASANVDDEVDVLLGEIEVLIVANQSLSGTVLSTTLSNTEIRIDSEGQNDIGVGVLTYECKYVS